MSIGRHLAVAAGLALAQFTILPAEEPGGPGEVSITAAELDFFEAKIRPALVNHCYTCHSVGAGEPKGGLRLDTAAGLLAGGGSGPAVVAGKPNESLLVEALRYESFEMPPQGKLPDDVIADFVHWIEMGVPDPRKETSEIAPATPAAETGGFWSFQPPLEAEVPEPADSLWAQSDIDRFILVRLEGAGLEPSAPADRRTLLRRLWYDLVGLPPSADEVESFVADQSPDAVSKAVDRLLASPNFGERWGRYWLDVARYADTKGYVFQEDRNYAAAYTYRDWVISALNSDMPYDRFLVYQIAADQAAPPEEQPAALAAMGFLTLGRRFIQNKHDIIDDRIDVLTRGTMALTVSCARCHDHKYDPIPTADYYSLYGVFASSEEPGGDPSPLRLVDAASPVTPRILLRGNPGNRGPEVPRQFLAVLAGKDRRPFEQGSGRLELAQAIANADNPLTARVWVNRVWGHLFGEGFVTTPSDFGTRSDSPSHPELLDHLALGFIADGWSTKRLIRRIVLSSVYQQSSQHREDAAAVDPENRLLWKMNRRRLDLEALRDSLLAAAGSLDLTLGGPAVQLTEEPFPNRRTVYGFIERQNLPGMFRTFDFASPDAHAPKRYQTTVPQQALFMMNSPFVRQQAERLAGRTAQIADRPQRIGELYRCVFSREPSDEQLRLATAFIESASMPAGDDSAPPADEAWIRLAHVLLMTNELAFVD